MEIDRSHVRVGMELVGSDGRWRRAVARNSTLVCAGRQHRRRFLRCGLSVAGLVMLAGCGLLPSRPPPAKVRRIGYLALGSSEPSPRVEAFRQGLAELGWVEGQTIAIELRAVEEEDRLPDLAAELVRLEAEVIVALSTPAVRAASQATSTTPIIMGISGDPVRTGLVASLARPGGNVTGLTALSRELSAKRLELLKDAFPGISRVAVLWNVSHADKALDFQETQLAAQALGLQLQSLQVGGPDDFEGAFEAAIRGRSDALVTFADPLTVIYGRRIVDLAAKSRLPAMYEVREFVDAGGLMAYGPNLPVLFRRAATYVDRILKGARPADLPVEQPTEFDFVINLRTAQAIGLRLPQSLLAQATEVIR